MTEQKPHPKQACIDCHFLSGYRFRSTMDMSEPHVHVLPAVDRDALRRRHADFRKHLSGVHCSFGVWVESSQSKSHNSIENTFARILDIERKDGPNQCGHFLKHHPGMSTEAAIQMVKRDAREREELQEAQDQAQRDAEAQRRENFNLFWVIFGVGIAAVAFIAALIAIAQAPGW